RLPTGLGHVAGGQAQGVVLDEHLAQHLAQRLLERREPLAHALDRSLGGVVAEAADVFLGDAAGEEPGGGETESGRPGETTDGGRAAHADADGDLAENGAGGPGSIGAASSFTHSDSEPS